jgi:hypothetical protein
VNSQFIVVALVGQPDWGCGKPEARKLLSKRKTRMQKRQILIVLTLVMALVMGTAVVHALNTPDWWDNPGGVYTTWNTTGQFFGNASNNTGSNQTLTIENDVAACNSGDHIEIWMQIAWVNTGTPNVSLRTANQFDRVVQWTTSALGCPGNVTTPLPSYDGFGFLTNELGFTPTGNSLPGNLPLDNGYERSFAFTNSTATCARTSTVFDIPDGAGFEYRIEVQSICVSPTAVTLQSFSTATSHTPVVAVVGFLSLAVVAFGLVIVRRERHG